MLEFEWFDFITHSIKIIIVPAKKNKIIAKDFYQVFNTYRTHDQHIQQDNNIHEQIFLKSHKNKKSESVL